MNAANASSSPTILLVGGELDGDTFPATTDTPQDFVTVIDRPEIWYDASCFCILSLDETIAPETVVMKVLDPFEMQHSYTLSHVDQESGNRIYVPTHQR